MLNIYLARHGQDLDNAAGTLNGQRNQPLSKTGISQAKELAQKISSIDIHFDKIYCSPLLRAKETAEIISRETGNVFEILDLLIERDYGDMTGKAQSEIMELCSPDILETNTVTYFLSPPNAETFPDLIVRANKILAAIKQIHSDGNILLVTHGDMGKMIYCAYYKLEWADVLRDFHFGNSDLLLMSPASDYKNMHVIKIKQHNV